MDAIIHSMSPDHFIEPENAEVILEVLQKELNF
jgi:hypothetical protein